MSASPAPEAPPTRPAEVARASIEALSAGDLDRVESFLHENVVDTFLPFGERRGPAAVRGFFEELRAAFPDFAVTAEDVVGDEHGAAVKWHATGTFTGDPFQGITANGSRVDILGVDFMEIDSGRVRRNRVAYDGADFARQLGVLPARGSAADRATVAAFNARTGLIKRWRERERQRRESKSWGGVGDNER